MADKTSRVAGFSALGFVVFVIGAFYAIAAAPGGEYWWHITMGRLADVYVAVPTNNFLLYTAALDAPARSVGWLSQWWLFELHELGGLLAAHYARSVLVGLIAIVSAVYALSRSSFRSEAVFPTLMALVTLTLPFAELGPELFGAVLIAFSVVLSFAVHRGELHRIFIAPLVLLPLIWIHVDTSFFVPAMLAVAFAIFGRDSSLSRRGGLLVAVASAAASLVNPGLYAPWEALLLDIATFEIQLDASRVWISLTAVAGALVSFAYALRARPADGASFFVLTFMLVWGLFVDVSLLVASPAAVGATAEVDFERSASARSTRHWIVGSLFFVAAVVLQPIAPVHLEIRSSFEWIRGEDPLAGIAAADEPVIHALVAKSRGSAPRVFHEPEYAGLIAWELSDPREPRGVIFSDPRVDLTTAEMRELHQQMLIDPSLWRGVFQQYDIDMVLLDSRRHEEVAASIASDPGWSVIVEEGEAVLIARDASAAR